LNPEFVYFVSAIYFHCKHNATKPIDDYSFCEGTCNI